MDEKKRIRKLHSLEKECRRTHWFVKGGRFAFTVKYGLAWSIMFMGFMFILNKLDQYDHSFWEDITHLATPFTFGLIAVVASSFLYWSTALKRYEQQKLRIEELRMGGLDIGRMKADEKSAG